MLSGHLIFYRDGELLAAPFDAATLTVTGSPRRVIESVPQSSTLSPTPVADVSGTGTLVYASATTTRLYGYRDRPPNNR